MNHDPATDPSPSSFLESHSPRTNPQSFAFEAVAALMMLWMLMMGLGCNAGRNAIQTPLIEADGPSPMVTAELPDGVGASSTGSLNAIQMDETGRHLDIGPTPKTAMTIGDLWITSPKDTTAERLVVQEYNEDGQIMRDLTIEGFTTIASVVIDSEANRLAIVGQIVAEMSETERELVRAWAVENWANPLAQIVLGAMGVPAPVGP